MLWNSKLWLSPIDDSFNPSKSQKEQDLCLIYFFTNCRSLKIAGRRWTWASMSEYLLVCYHMRKGRILDNFFCSLIHKLLEVDKIVNLSALIWTQTNYLSHAIIVYKKCLNTQIGNFALISSTWSFTGRVIDSSTRNIMMPKITYLPSLQP